MKLIGYVRVSTDKQADSGLSIEAQKEQIRTYCSLYEHVLCGMFSDEGVSAKTLNRPGFEDAQHHMVTDGRDGMIVSKLDRLTRSIVDLNYLLTHVFNKYQLISVGEQIDTSSASGRMVLNILMSVSQWEREAIGERTKVAMGAKKARGERVGSVPYGWCVPDQGQVLVKDEPEQKIISHIIRLHTQEWHESKGASLREIASWLNNHDHTNRAGRPFQAQTISNIIKAQENE